MIKVINNLIEINAKCILVSNYFIENNNEIFNWYFTENKMKLAKGYFDIGVWKIKKPVNENNSDSEKNNQLKK